MTGKSIILGVAAIWDRRKGIDDFFRLSKKLNDDYRIILVGLTKKEMANLPERIIGINRTNSIKELATLYSIADVFINPTYEDNYPTTNLEAISCGTPVITYQTGGSPESAEKYGMSVPKGELIQLANAIKIIGKIKQGEFNVGYENTVNKYIQLYLN